MKICNIEKLPNWKTDANRKIEGTKNWKFWKSRNCKIEKSKIKNEKLQNENLKNLKNRKSEKSKKKEICIMK